MIRIACLAALVIGLAFVSLGQGQGQEAAREACMERCRTQPQAQDPELERQEIVSLEKEAARAIQLNSGTFFYRIYSDDFAGTLSHGQQINKLQCNGQHLSSQIRAIHVYIDTPNGWHVFSAQTTNLPPDVQQPL